ncbi:hypothetical protein PVAND_013012 [Polypedilum vanderplanki]|uniref:Transmembrane protein n=1 Tax=Polypedilum vanderplanki TaxID=319348 RepID=A0A9J6CQ58_POLVA|nr:hypothetical protein PVAND_013012 [Polypedilum vanderplanki]
MWAKIPLLEYLEYLQNLKFRLGSKDFNDNVNFMFIFICFMFVIYFLFYQFLKKLLIKSKVSQIKHRQSINFIWNFIFYLCCTTFLILYHNFFIKEELDVEKGKWYPKRRNLLFYKPCDMVKFKIITCILAGFNITSSVFDLIVRDVSEAISKLLFTCLIMICYSCGYENYSIVLNINLGLFNMFTELLSLLALHTEKDQISMFRVFVVFKFISWIYIFLNFLPFQYMMPTIHAHVKDFNIGLTSIFILWYISRIWCSPLLHMLQHQLYHLTAFDCQGESSLTRCLMLKDTPELKHHKNLKRAYMEVKLFHQRHQLNKLNLSEHAASATAFHTISTIKCFMTIKRKLKRIRSHHQQQNQEQQHHQQQPTKNE